MPEGDQSGKGNKVQHWGRAAGIYTSPPSLPRPPSPAAAEIAAQSWPEIRIWPPLVAATNMVAKEQDLAFLLL
jgi:hypothetical protein